MANIYLRQGVWYARYQHKGKAYLRSTGIAAPVRGREAIAKARADAEAELHRMLVELRGGESVEALFNRLNSAIDSLPEKEKEPRRIALADRLRSGTTARLPVEAAWDAWLNSPRRGRPSSSTITGYLGYWGRDKVKKRGTANSNSFQVWLKKTHPDITFIHEISDSIAEEYASHLMKSGIAPRTYNATLTFLRSMFRTLRNRAGLTQNVWEDIPLVANDTQGRRNLTNKELRKVCISARGDLRYLIAIGLYTGLRLGDAVTLQWNGGTVLDEFRHNHLLGVDLAKQVIRVVPQKTRRKKKVVVLPIHPVLYALLTQLKEKSGDESEYLFPEWAGIYKRGRIDAITDIIQRHFKACGIETTEQVTDGSRKRAIVRVGFHSLRHSFVSLCAANKVPQHAIQELVGHGSPAMTMLYSHADDQQKIEAISVLPEMAFDTKLIEAKATVKSEPTPKRSGKARTKAKSTKQRPVRQKK